MKSLVSRAFELVQQPTQAVSLMASNLEIALIDLVGFRYDC